ncbi:hypothetical protein Ancab_010720 [Ancistrocladus abbreviatus]
MSNFCCIIFTRTNVPGVLGCSSSSILKLGRFAYYAIPLISPLCPHSQTSIAFGVPAPKPLRLLGQHRNRNRTTAMMSPDNPVLSDIYATATTGAVALSMLRFWKETAKRGVFDQKLNRKLVHVSIGLGFMLCWPLFSSGRRGAVLAGLIPGLNIIHVLPVGLGLWKDEAAVKSMSRYGDYRSFWVY